MASTNPLASITSWDEKTAITREKVGGLGDVDMEEEEKAMLRGMVSSYRSSMDSLRSNIAGMELMGNTQLETMKNQQNQIDKLGQTISALVVRPSVLPEEQPGRHPGHHDHSFVSPFFSDH